MADKQFIVSGPGGGERRVSESELEQLVDKRARQLVEKNAQPSADPPGTFDEVALLSESGQPRRLSRAQFEALPLDQRVAALLRKRLKFYCRGTEVPARAALKNY